MVESDLRPIAEKVLDFLCILPMCDEAHPLSQKAVNVALPILGAIVVIGVGAKLLSLRKRTIVPPLEMAPHSPSAPQLGTEQTQSQFQILRDQVLKSIGPETQTRDALELFQSANVQYHVAYQNRSTDPHGFIKAADRRMKVTFYISYYALMIRHTVSQTARQNPVELKQNGLSEQSSDLEILKKNRGFMEVIQYFSDAYSMITGAYKKHKMQQYDLDGKMAANWSTLYEGYTDMMKQGHFLPNSS